MVLLYRREQAILFAWISGWLLCQQSRRTKRRLQAIRKLIQAFKLKISHVFNLTLPFLAKIQKQGYLLFIQLP